MGWVSLGCLHSVLHNFDFGVGKVLLVDVSEDCVMNVDFNGNS